MPSGSIFADKGPAVFVDGDSAMDLLAILAASNAAPFRLLIGLQMSFGSYEVGVIQRTPYPKMSAEVSRQLARLAERSWSMRRSLDTVSEVSHAFVVPALLQVEDGSFSERVSAWGERVASVEAALHKIQEEIDELCFELYGISEEDRRAITEGIEVAADEESDGSGDDGENSDDDAVEIDPGGLAAGLVSWTVGVAVGRFDVRLATGVQAWTAEPDPFDPLPVSSAAMLIGEDGLPVTEVPAEYPTAVSPVMVDDPGHHLDITGRLRSVFDVVFGGDADRWWSDMGTTLSLKGGEVGTWLRRGFFDYHLKTYSRSRRKAPILWPIGTRSGSYLLWFYAHRVTSDTLFQVLNDLVAPKVILEEQQLTRLRQDAGPDPTASQRKIIDRQESFLAELRELQEAITALTPLWAPDLNDGIVIVLAPLWELFVHHRTWSSELKRHWGKLVKGEYDWAQLAMHLWPERVIPKCAEDRSLAIAHGLEEVFWFQDDSNNDKWHPREHPTTPVDELVAKRQNRAVAAALNHLANS